MNAFPAASHDRAGAGRGRVSQATGGAADAAGINLSPGRGRRLDRKQVRRLPWRERAACIPGQGDSIGAGAGAVWADGLLVWSPCGECVWAVRWSEAERLGLVGGERLTAELADALEQSPSAGGNDGAQTITCLCSGHSRRADRGPMMPGGDGSPAGRSFFPDERGAA